MKLNSIYIVFTRKICGILYCYFTVCDVYVNKKRNSNILLIIMKKSLVKRQKISSKFSFNFLVKTLMSIIKMYLCDRTREPLYASLWLLHYVLSY